MSDARVIEVVVFFLVITVARICGQCLLRLMGKQFQSASYAVGVFACGIATAVAQFLGSPR